MKAARFKVRSGDSVVTKRTRSRAATANDRIEELLQLCKILHGRTDKAFSAIEQLNRSLDRHDKRISELTLLVGRGPSAEETANEYLARRKREGTENPDDSTDVLLSREAWESFMAGRHELEKLREEHQRVLNYNIELANRNEQLHRENMQLCQRLNLRAQHPMLMPNNGGGVHVHEQAQVAVAR